MDERSPHRLQLITFEYGEMRTCENIFGRRPALQHVSEEWQYVAAVRQNAARDRLLVVVIIIIKRISRWMN